MFKFTATNHTEESIKRVIEDMLKQLETVKQSPTWSPIMIHTILGM